jgi:hypothetical protein
VAPQVRPFALTNADIALKVLDLLHDALESQPALFDAAALVTAYEQDKLPVKLTKSKIAGIFATSIGSSLDARQDALRRGAVEVFLKTKKVDRNDQILIEWCAFSSARRTAFCVRISRERLLAHWKSRCHLLIQFRHAGEWQSARPLEPHRFGELHVPRLFDQSGNSRALQARGR